VGERSGLLLTGTNDQERRYDFFIAYAQPDRPWAEWIAWDLEDVGYRVLVQAWDFVAGSNWQAGMQDGVCRSGRTIALLSPAYLRSVYGQQEWQAAQAADPRGFERKLLPIRIADCERPGLLAAVVSFDLFGLTEDAARRRLREQIKNAENGRAKPDKPPNWPGDKAMTSRPAFPGPGPGGIPRRTALKVAISLVAVAVIGGAISGVDGRIWQLVTAIGAPPDPEPSRPADPTLAGHAGPVNSVAFSPDGKVVATATADGAVQLWDAETMSLKASLIDRSGFGAVNSVAFSPDGSTLASAGADHVVRLWDVSNRRLTARLTGHSDVVNSVAFSSDGELLLSGSADRTARLWGVRTENSVATLNDQPASVTSVAFLDAEDLLTAFGDLTMRFWGISITPPTARGLLTTSGITSLTALAVSRSSVIAIGGAPGTVLLWDGNKGQPLPPTIYCEAPVNALAFDRQGTILAGGLSNGNVLLWDTSASTHPEIEALAGHVGAVTSVAFSPDGKRLASGSVDGTVRLWKLG
jgi:TIR domain/WD domain, G-beta repeat